MCHVLSELSVRDITAEVTTNTDDTSMRAEWEVIMGYCQDLDNDDDNNNYDNQEEEFPRLRYVTVM